SPVTPATWVGSRTGSPASAAAGARRTPTATTATCATASRRARPGCAFPARPSPATTGTAARAIAIPSRDASTLRSPTAPGATTTTCARRTTPPRMGRGGAAPTPNPGTPRPADTCEPSTGCVRTPVPSGAPCNDQNACTVGDACLRGACVGGSVVPCTSSGPCTVGSCDPTRGCIQLNAVDGTPCGPNGLVCLSGVCRYRGRRGSERAIPALCNDVLVGTWR